MYAKLSSVWLSTGKATLRVRNQSSTTNGSVDASSRSARTRRGWRRRAAGSASVAGDVPSPLRTLVDAGEEQRGAEAERQRAAHVEADVAHPVGPRQQPQRHHDADDAQRRLHGEDRPPPDVLDERPAGDDTEHRRARGDEAPVPERPHPVLWREHPVDVGHRRRTACRAGRRRQDPEQDHRERVPRDGGQRGEQAGEREPDHEDPLVTPQVAGLAERRPDDAEGEHRAGDHPRQRRRRAVEVRRRSAAARPRGS